MYRVLPFLIAAALTGCAPSPPPLPPVGPWFPINDPVHVAAPISSPQASPVNQEAGR